MTNDPLKPTARERGLDGIVAEKHELVRLTYLTAAAMTDRWDWMIHGHVVPYAYPCCRRLDAGPM